MIEPRKLLRMSALRQALILTGIFIGILLLGGVVTRFVVRGVVDWEVDRNLVATAKQLEMEVKRVGPVSAIEPRVNPERFTGRVVGFRFTNGNSPLGDLRAPVFTTLGLSSIEEYDLFVDGDEELNRANAPSQTDEGEDFGYYWRVIVVQLKGGRLAVAAPLDEIEMLETALPVSLLITGTLMATITLVGGLLFGFGAQRRTTLIERKLDLIAGGDLSIRLAPKSPKDDLDHLALRIDETTAKLELLMSQVKNLSVSIAHDLRMPLARLRAGLEREISKERPDTAAVESALAETDQIVSIFDTIMRIAGLNSGKGKAQFVSIYLEETAKKFTETYRAVVEDSGREFHLMVESPATIEGDATAIIQALSNLLQNAMIHTPVGSTITLFVDGTRIGVADNGPGIPANERENVQRPMYRIEHARTTPGVGLGLAMVRAVTDLHGADIRFSDTHATSPNGLTVTLTFKAKRC